MKKNTFLFLILFVIIKLQAQTYQISFAGTGASSTIDSVKVENLTQFKTVSLNGSDILNLYNNTGINEINNNTDNSLQVYPNPMTGYCLINFEAIAQGETTLSLYDIAGKRIIQVQEFLFKGNHTYSLSGIGSGIYILKVESNQYTYSVKIVSINLTNGIAEIKHIETSPLSTSLGILKSLKDNKSSKDIPYSPGDTFKLTGFSGIYSTVFMLVPSKSQTVTFNFIVCTDGDNNNYAVVQIGTQTWMEENLKTTKYNNGSAIPNVTVDSVWANLSTPAYCWYNDSLKYKNIYGGLYNWFAVDTNILCPSGWHVPDSTEWYKLITYLGGANVAGGKMKDTCSTYWISPSTGATNSSGFTALPGGYLNGWGETFDHQGDFGYWWTATEFFASLAWDCYLGFDGPYAGLGYESAAYDPKTYGFSVRCVKN